MPIRVPVKLGRPGLEVEFTTDVNELESLRVNHNWVAANIQNLAGEDFVRVFRRNKPKFTLSATLLEPKVEELEGLRHITNEMLSLSWANARRVFSDRYITTGLNMVRLSSSPMTLHAKAYADAALPAQIAILGVFAGYKSDGTQATTNFFNPGGTYNASTRDITLGTSPGAIGTVVFVNWTYTGALVILRSLSMRLRGGDVDGVPWYDADVDLEGV